MLSGLEARGICRVVVPDLDKIIALYNSDNPRIFIANIYEVGSRSAVKNPHHSAFTGAFLTQLFSDAGYSECKVLNFRVGRCPDIDRLDNRPDSLFFEACK